MSTRAVYSFIDDETFHVYGHFDGYPKGAVEKLQNMVKFAWKLPRFEAMDCSAAFIAGNKKEGGGGIYITRGWEFHCDLEFRYEITVKKRKYQVKAFSRCSWETSGEESYEQIFEGTLEEFVEWAQAQN